ncbi:(2Fe-2S)-binding protein [Paraliobacillus quinghaiensis]|uniref:(2Fe-2S)-binding protein n=1 Tax=Paraliobacillus quinghaiensis TaxID=470815 RepID=A0A917WQL6_9BACI|nr:FAD-dependent oxidoreductase [Paraliobacillus quinghaiensis]GGM23431.1 (2Fe-2S)-binding protein [Paraliobacillus quinghaiensis]
MNKSYQVPSNTASYWKNTSPLPAFPQLTQDINVDIAIVGAGITGITTAYLLRKQGLKVALIEADTILSGTTEYTTAKITAQHGLIYDELIQHFGEDKAKLYYEAAMDAKQLITDTIVKHNIACEFSNEDAYIYTNSDKEMDKMRNEYKAYQKLSIEGELVDQIPLNIPVKKALVMKNQAQFHPLLYLKHLVETMVEDGVEIYEHTTATDITYNAKPMVQTKGKQNITCEKVVIASHYPFKDGSGFYFSRMYPERSYLIAVTTNKKFPGGMYINAEQPTRTIRATMDKGEEVWLIGGERHKTGHEKETVDHHIELEKFANNTFGIKEYKYRWSAQDLTTLDNMPYIGPLTKHEPNTLVATGYRKWGMTSGTVAAMIISDTIMNKGNRFASLFGPSRFDFDPDVKNFIKNNIHVAKHMVKGKLDIPSDKIDELEKDDAVIVRENGKRIGVYQDEQGNINRLDTTCPHMKCEVNWNKNEKTWDCPCHGSRFSKDGKVVEGPAKQALKGV